MLFKFHKSDRVVGIGGRIQRYEVTITNASTKRIELSFSAKKTFYLYQRETRENPQIVETRLGVIKSHFYRRTNTLGWDLGWIFQFMCLFRAPTKNGQKIYFAFLQIPSKYFS